MLDSFKRFASKVTAKFGAFVAGQPEDQLRSPLEVMLTEVGHLIGKQVLPKGETTLSEGLGRPDYGVLVDSLLCGHIELKAPGCGANPSKFKGHDRAQWERFKCLPNLIYSDGNEWSLFRNGEPIRRAQFSGDVTEDGASAITKEDSGQLEKLLRDFLNWQPVVPKKADQLADLLAPLCRLLRDEVLEAIQFGQKDLIRLATEWRDLLFPGATNERFADTYAQTVTFALLLARSEGSSTLAISDAIKALAVNHNLMSRALQVLTDPQTHKEIGASIELLQRVIDHVPTGTLGNGKRDPWLYFYEDFLAAYDPKLRKDAGAYYTPVQVVQAQVTLVEEILINRFGKVLGFAEADVVTLDPAVGTGTYLLGVVDHAMNRVKEKEGAGAVAARATLLAQNLYGFEILVGPYAVADLRLTRSLTQHGGHLSQDGLGICLTNTLESPHTKPTVPPLFYEPIAREHRRALMVKESIPVLVCIGNPPYDRHEAATTENKSATGGWVRWGENGDGVDAILDDFLRPARESGHGIHLKNLYNLYVYFWRWALWKVFEHDLATGPGVVSFISASSFLDGDAFSGMREYMRRLCDEIWIIDLGGEGRGTRKSENIFAIKTPVAISVAARYKTGNPKLPAQVHYTRFDENASQKLARLDHLARSHDLKWDLCPSDWQAAFRPAGVGNYFAWPALTDILPWRQSGIKAGRTWVISFDADVLKERVAVLRASPPQERSHLFKDSPTGRKAADKPAFDAIPAPADLARIFDATEKNVLPPIANYGFRSLDRQKIIADSRFLDRAAPSLWQVQSDNQIFFTSLLNHPLGHGPAVTCSAYIPDLHHFRGSYGAKEVMPLYRDAAATEPNLADQMIPVLSQSGIDATAHEVFAYIYAVLCQPSFTETFYAELTTKELRVPVTRNPQLFSRGADLGKRLICLHTFGERYHGDRPCGYIPPGIAKCIKAVSDNEGCYPQRAVHDAASHELFVGDGVFAPVSESVGNYEVSGLKVLESWLSYRVGSGTGRRSSPLDEIRPQRWLAQYTTELLRLLDILEHTLRLHNDQATLLKEILADELYSSEEFGPIHPTLRKPPKVDKETQLDL